MKKILVTGAGGYIGRHVVKQLLALGAAVIAVDFNVNEIDERAERLQIDIFVDDDELFEKLGKPDACIHMAWKDGFVHNSDAHMKYLSSHFNFIKNMCDQGLQQLIVMGTMHEVGYFEGAINENTPCNPISMYGIAKDALRRSTILYLKDKPTVMQWLRAYYILGDDEKNSSIFAKIIRAEKEGQKYFPFTTGNNQYDFIDVELLAKQIAKCSLQHEIIGIINCCSGITVSLANRVEQFISEHHFKIKLQYGAFPDRVYDSPAVWGNAEKIHEIMRL